MKKVSAGFSGLLKSSITPLKEANSTNILNERTRSLTIRIKTASDSQQRKNCRGFWPRSADDKAAFKVRSFVFTN
jgi:hypothetical protein